MSAVIKIILSILAIGLDLTLRPVKGGVVFGLF